MRDERLVLVIAEAVSRKLKQEISVLQTEAFTEWSNGIRGYAIGPYTSSHSPRKLVERITKGFERKGK